MVRPRPLTERQRMVLDAIAESTDGGGRPPTLREIGAKLGITSTNGVRDHLEALEAKGYIRRDARSARGIHLVHPDLQDAHDAADAQVRPDAPLFRARPLPDEPPVTRPAGVIAYVPVLGRVAAGQPILADQNIEQHLAIDTSLIRDGDVFALRVHGDSMRDAAILDGDYVFVRQQATASPNDIVVVLIGDEETTVKRFVPAGEFIRLEPANPAYAPIVLRRDDPGMAILGRVCAVLRTIR